MHGVHSQRSRLQVILLYCNFKSPNKNHITEDPRGRAVKGVGLLPLGCWSLGFESARGMDVCLLCLYVVLSCVGSGLCDGLITRPEESYRVSVCVIKKPRKEGQRSILDYNRL
jgi:hypothetical protein